jgi:thymidylate synthase
LIQDPWTRQAWIPLFFPEDTGGEDEGRKGILHMRKPCTLGWQFLRRGNLLHLFYPLRSCDLFRHFRNDCYLAVRLLLWVLRECRKKDSLKWDQVRPGTYSMWITSLHLFEGDRVRLLGEKP